MNHLIAEAQPPSNGWDALIVVAFFALIAFVVWAVTR